MRQAKVECATGDIASLMQHYTARRRTSQSLKIGEAAIVHIRRGALFNDIGKMDVTNSILQAG